LIGSRGRVVAVPEDDVIASILIGLLLDGLEGAAQSEVLLLKALRPSIRGR
jgi:hypothetical protein